METTNVGAQPQTMGYKSPSIVSSVISNGIIGAGLGAAIAAIPATKQDEFVKQGIQQQTDALYEKRVSAAKTKIETLEKEVQAATDDTVKASKTKELTRLKNKIANFEKHGKKGYADTFIKSSRSSQSIEDLTKMYEGHKAKTLGEEAAKAAKDLAKSAKKSRVLQSAKQGAMWCAGLGLAIGIIKKLTFNKAMKNAQAHAGAQEQAPPQTAPTEA